MTHRRYPDGPPVGLFDLDPRRFLTELGGPTWLRLPGTGGEPARAIATLLHGDEPTGVQALLEVLRRRQRPYPFDLHLVVFNVEAALAGPGFAHRYLDHQEDGNRIWGVAGADTPDRRAADGILGDLSADPLAMLVDVHNTTGDNPFHAIVPSDDPAVINLATRFSTTLLRWDLGNGTLMEAVAPMAPAVAVECGLAGRRTSLAFAVDGLRRFLGPPLESGEVVRDHDLLGDLLRVTVGPSVRMRFAGVLDDEVDLVVPPDADGANLVEVAAGHVLGHARPGAPCPLRVTDARGHDVTAATLEVTSAGAVVTRRRQVPVMVVRSVAAARKDCLCYLASVGRSARPVDADLAAASHASGSMPSNRSSSGSVVATPLDSRS